MRIILMSRGTISAFEGWEAHVTSVLDRVGRRSGQARDAVIELLGAQRCCMTAQEIFDALRAEGRRVGLATVYRALEQLTELGLVQRLEFPDAARYEPVLPSGEHHHHVVCDDCGKVEPFSDPPLERALGRLEGTLGYELEAHDVVLRGSCGECRRPA
jgi:Fur family transcriptional regulator, ferric uptake regulator